MNILQMNLGFRYIRVTRLLTPLVQKEESEEKGMRLIQDFDTVKAHCKA